MKKEHLEEIMYLKIKNDETNNIFNNYNNFTRDEHVYQQTLKHCLFFLEDLIKERDHYRNSANKLADKLAKAQL